MKSKVKRHKRKLKSGKKINVKSHKRKKPRRKRNYGVSVLGRELDKQIERNQRLTQVRLEPDEFLFDESTRFGMNRIFQQLKEKPDTVKQALFDVGKEKRRIAKESFKQGTLEEDTPMIRAAADFKLGAKIDNLRKKAEATELPKMGNTVIITPEFVTEQGRKQGFDLDDPVVDNIVGHALSQGAFARGFKPDFLLSRKEVAEQNAIKKEFRERPLIESFKEMKRIKEEHDNR